MVCGVMPSRAAVVRSITSVADKPLFCWSVFTSTMPGRVRILASIMRAVLVQVRQVVALERVLVLRGAGTAADAQVLHGLENERAARDMRRACRAGAR